jgi:hypothetical protein
MRVSPAVKVFSSHTATLCKFVFPESPQIWEFFQTVNDWFDILNSRVPKDADIEIRSAYGMSKEKQDLTLAEIENLILNMRCFKYSPQLKKFAPRPGLLPCQSGLGISITSLRGLFEDMKRNYRATYIKTRNLNQDILESFFSEIRALVAQMTMTIPRNNVISESDVNFCCLEQKFVLQLQPTSS